MIEISHLTKQYGKILAVDDISFTVEQGEIVGFLGPNGAGKSTTMNIITGYISGTSGSVKVCGYDIMEQPEEVKKRIGYLPEQPPLYMDMTVIEYLRFVAQLKKVKKNLIDNQLKIIMDTIKISHVSERLIKNLSKGYKQRVGFAQALIGAPEVLILDEPTVGLDPNQIIEIRKLVKELGEKHTVILSTHILSEVSAVCEKVVIINKGKIVAIDTPEHLSKLYAASGKLNIVVGGQPEEIINILKTIKGVENITCTGAAADGENIYTLECNAENEEVKKDITMKLAQAGYPITEMRADEPTLEDIFVKLTGGDSDKGRDTAQNADVSVTADDTDKEDK